MNTAGIEATGLLVNRHSRLRWDDKRELRHSRAGGNPATRTASLSTYTDLQSVISDPEPSRLSQLPTAGIENLITLDSRLRGNDEKEIRRSGYSGNSGNSGNSGKIYA